ncbi:MAG: NUDIX hydrolase [Bacilli bacterium]
MLEEKTVKSNLIFKGRVCNLIVEDVVLPSGEFSKREIVEIKDSVGIIAYTVDKKVLLIKQFRKPVNEVLYEIPAGCIDYGEDKLTAAKRELLEETGYGEGEFTLINNFFPSPGTNRQTHSIYLAKNVIKLSESLNLDSDEFLELVEVSFEEFEQLYKSGKLTDLKTSYAFLTLKSIL